MQDTEKCAGGKWQGGAHKGRLSGDEQGGWWSRAHEDRFSRGDQDVGVSPT